MTQTERPALPAYHLDYTAGRFVNTLTGETSTTAKGVILGYREGRVLWPSPGELPVLPLCVDGSTYGPCRCAFADWGPQGQAPDCSEELSVLLWQTTQVVVLTARRSQLRVLTQFIEMKALLGQPLHDQHVTISMVPAVTGDLHRLTLTPGAILPESESIQLAAVAERVRGTFEGLE
jgi:hypothetical protein